MLYETLSILYSRNLVEVVRLDSGCDTNGLDICGPAAGLELKTKKLQTSTNANKLF